MKANVIISPAIAEMIALCYTNIQSAVEYARGISSDKEVPTSVKDDFVSVAASLVGPIERIDRRIPKEAWQQFKTEIKEADALQLDNLKFLFARMTPAKKAMLELAAQGILNGELEIKNG